MKPRLIEKDEENTLECEGCGLRNPKFPYPYAWIRTGRSRRRIRRDGYTTAAHWCPACYENGSHLRYFNPRESEIGELRIQLLRAEGFPKLNGEITANEHLKKFSKEVTQARYEEASWWHLNLVRHTPMRLTECRFCQRIVLLEKQRDDALIRDTYGISEHEEIPVKQIQSGMKCKNCDGVSIQDELCATCLAMSSPKVD